MLYDKANTLERELGGGNFISSVEKTTKETDAGDGEDQTGAAVDKVGDRGDGDGGYEHADDSNLNDLPEYSFDEIGNDDPASYGFYMNTQGELVIPQLSPVTMSQIREESEMEERRIDDEGRKKQAFVECLRSKLEQYEDLTDSIKSMFDEGIHIYPRNVTIEGWREEFRRRLMKYHNCDTDRSKTYATPVKKTKEVNEGDSDISKTYATPVKESKEVNVGDSEGASELSPFHMSAETLNLACELTDMVTGEKRQKFKVHDVPTFDLLTPEDDDDTERNIDPVDSVILKTPFLQPDQIVSNTDKEHKKGLLWNRPQRQITLPEVCRSPYIQRQVVLKARRTRVEEMLADWLFAAVEPPW